MLARQLLLQRSRLPAPRALERVGGVQAQYAPSMYVGLWTRLAGFERDSLTRALERRAVVQGTLMRTTIHLVSRRDYWPFAAGVREDRRRNWLRTRKVPARRMAAKARRLRKLLEDGPMRRREIAEALGTDAVETNGLGLWVDLVRAPPSGTWERRSADLYAAAEEWIGPGEVNPADGVQHLVRSYLRGFGPATAAEIAGWAGLRPPTVAAELEGMRLRELRDDGGGELVDLPRTQLPDPRTPAPVRFLPVWDATLLVHARATGILSEEHRPLVFNPKTPHSVNTFLVDGVVAGTWTTERSRSRARLVVDSFDSIPRGARFNLREEGKALLGFIEDDADSYEVRLPR